MRRGIPVQEFTAGRISRDPANPADCRAEAKYASGSPTLETGTVASPHAMLALQSSTAAPSVAEQAEAPARALGGTATAQTHVPASTVLHLQAAAQRVEA